MQLKLSIGVIDRILLVDMGNNEHDLEELSEADFQEFLKHVNALLTHYVEIS